MSKFHFTRLRGQYVGVGWRAKSCLYCDQCMCGHHNRCLKGEDIIVGRHGGYAVKVRSQAIFAFPMPPDMDTRAAGPLFCGGITVFNPIIQNNMRGTDYVAIVGIGGLGHMVLQFLNSWDCEITVFSTNSEKEKDARKLGAHNFLNSRDPVAIKSATNSFDLVLVTANADVDWIAYLNSPKPGGKLHVVGATPPVKADVFALIASERSIGGSPTGSPITIRMML